MKIYQQSWAHKSSNQYMVRDVYQYSPDKYIHNTRTSEFKVFFFKLKIKVSVSHLMPNLNNMTCKITLIHYPTFR